MKLYGHEVLVDTKWLKTLVDEIDVTSIHVDGVCMISDTAIATSRDYNKIVGIVSKEAVEELRKKYAPLIKEFDDEYSMHYENELQDEIRNIREDILESLED